MEKPQPVFALIFFFSLAVTIYLLGNSITGYFAHTMYCENGECTAFCKFSIDCPGTNMVCCAQDSFGVCRDPAECTVPYVFQPDVNIEEIPETGQPSPFSANHIIALVAFAMITIVSGIIYFLETKRKI